VVRGRVARVVEVGDVGVARGADAVTAEERHQQRGRVGRVGTPAVDGDVERLALSAEPLAELGDREGPDVHLDPDRLEVCLEQERDRQRARERVEDGGAAVALRQASCSVEIRRRRVEPGIPEPRGAGRQVLTEEGDRVLNVAFGTGVVARLAGERAASEARSSRFR
jgi:hypothetical protein